MLVSGLIPLVEAGFQYTTNLKLVELANMNNPLLRELMIQAPGTYHHSIIVGNLAESAAETIGANPLLVRVAAYYHDHVFVPAERAAIGPAQREGVRGRGGGQRLRPHRCGHAGGAGIPDIDEDEGIARAMQGAEAGTDIV